MRSAVQLAPPLPIGVWETELGGMNWSDFLSPDDLILGCITQAWPSNWGLVELF